MFKFVLTFVAAFIFATAASAANYNVKANSRWFPVPIEQVHAGSNVLALTGPNARQLLCTLKPGNLMKYDNSHCSKASLKILDAATCGGKAFHIKNQGTRFYLGVCADTSRIKEGIVKIRGTTYRISGKDIVKN